MRVAVSAFLVGLGFGPFAAAARAQTWVHEASLAPDQGAGQFGYAVALDGDQLFCGAPYGDAVHSYAFAGQVWRPQQRITASDGALGEVFGAALAAEAETLVVGAAQAASGSGRPGAAYVFRFDGTAWVEEQRLVPSTALDGDSFGKALAVQGGTIVVGAPDTASGPDSSSGAAYVFRYDGKTWGEAEVLRSSAPTENAWFGYSVALDGSRLLVGAMGEDDESGAVYVFEFDGGAWQEQHRLKPQDAEQYDIFGVSVALAAETAVTGAVFDGDRGWEAGAAYVFRWEDGAWTEKQKLVASDGQGHAYFGHSVAASGRVVAVGAPGDGDRDGAAYIYLESGGGWVEECKLTAKQGGAGSLGHAVATDGARLVAGAPTDDTIDRESGAAYVFRGPPVIEAVVPKRARYDLPEYVTLFGDGFAEGGVPEVRFAGVAATDVQVLDSRTVTCRTPVFPPGQLDVGVSYSDANGTGEIAEAFIFTPALRLAGSWFPGGEVTLTYLFDPGDSIYAIYGLPPVQSFRTPPFDGELCIWPFRRLLLVLGWPLDEWRQVLTIPDDPALSGLEVLLQGLVGPELGGTGKDAAWTNCALLTIE